MKIQTFSGALETSWELTEKVNAYLQAEKDAGRKTTVLATGGDYRIAFTVVSEEISA